MYITYCEPSNKLLLADMMMKDYKMEQIFKQYSENDIGWLHSTMTFSSGGESMREYLETQKRYNNIIL